MTTQSKRKMLTLAGAAAVLVASVAITAAQSQEDASAAGDQDPLVGTWIVHVIPMGRPEFTAISSFNLGGLFAQMDTNSRTTSALGRWNRIDDLTYTNDFILFNVNPFTSTATVHVHITLDENLEAFTATYEFQDVDPDGMVIGSGGGTRRGRRATFEFQK
jgi:hypothetical protein